MNESRCDERLKVRVEESTCLTYTGSYAPQIHLLTQHFFLRFSHLRVSARSPDAGTSSASSLRSTLLTFKFINGWFICSRLKKRRKPRVKLVTLKLC